ncbi:MAG: hypothetical protein AB1530_03720 [Candidatus Omnitrophota bacterium]
MWLLPVTKRRSGQVVLETVVVVMCLAVIAISSARLFSSLNLHMLDRLNIFRQSRLQAVNAPHVLSGRLLPVAPLSRGGYRELSNPTTLLDYAPKNIVNIEPYIPQGAFFWDSYGVQYETELLLNTILKYMLNQAYWYSTHCTWNSATKRFEPSRYIIYIQRMMDRTMPVMDKIYQNLLDSFDEYVSTLTDPARIAEAQAARAQLIAAKQAAIDMLAFIKDNIGDLERDRYGRIIGPSDLHDAAVTMLRALVIGGDIEQEINGMPVQTWHDGVGELPTPPGPFFNLYPAIWSDYTYRTINVEITSSPSSRRRVESARNWMGRVVADAASQQQEAYEIAVKCYDHLTAALENFNDDEARNYYVEMARLEASALADIGYASRYCPP